MRVKLLRDYTAFTPAGKAGTWREVEPHPTATAVPPIPPAGRLSKMKPAFRINASQMDRHPRQRPHRPACRCRSL